jgi:MraZ protein
MRGVVLAESCLQFNHTKKVEKDIDALWVIVAESGALWGNSGLQGGTTFPMVKELKRTVFVGTYRHAVDEKKRVAIPARWRAAASGASEFCVLPDPKNCLVVVSSNLVEKLLEKADEMPLYGDEHQPQRDGLRVIASLAHVTPVDSQGRINISDQLLEKAGITDEAVLVGVLNKFEIWSPKRLEAELKGRNIVEAAKEVGL